MAGLSPTQETAVYKIRLAVPQDFHQILPMAQKFYATTEHAKDMEFDLESVLEYYITMLKNGFVVVAEEDGKLVGMLGAIVSWFPLNKKYKMATEAMWWVEPEYRGLAIAGDMKKAFEAEAKKDECDKVVMSALSTSPDGLHDYYLSQGYALSETAYIRSL